MVVVFHHSHRKGTTTLMGWLEKQVLWEVTGTGLATVSKVSALVREAQELFWLL